MTQLDLAPPAQRHSPTSVEAAESVKGKAATLRDVVYAHIKAAGARGCTDEELYALTGLPPNTCRPRRVELLGVQRGGLWAIAPLIRDSGQTRKGSSGRGMTVWVAC